MNVNDRVHGSNPPPVVHVMGMNKHSPMDSLIRRIPSHVLVAGLYIILVAFAIVAFKNPV